MTSEEYTFFRKILDQPDLPTKEQFAKAIEILEETAMMSIQPSKDSQYFEWIDGFSVNNRAVYVFTNIPDMNRFARDFLLWSDEEIWHGVPMVKICRMSDAVSFAKKMDRQVIIDYQTNQEKGFWIFNPSNNLLTVGLR